MARTETSRLVITLDVDRATQKLLGLGTTIDGVETKFNKAGQAAQRFGTTATKSGQQSAAAAVGFQTYAQGALNVSTSIAMTYTSFTNLASAEHRVSTALVGLARAEDLLNNKRARANDMVKAGTANGEKYRNIVQEITTAEADLLAKTEKLRIEKSKMNDVFILFGMNLANVAVSLATTIAAMKAATAASKAHKAEMLLQGQVVTSLSVKMKGLLIPSLAGMRTALSATAAASAGATGAVGRLSFAFRGLMSSMGIVSIALLGISTAVMFLLPNMEQMSREAFGMSDSMSDVEATLNKTNTATGELDESIQKLSGSMKKDIPAGAIVVAQGLQNMINHATDYSIKLGLIAQQHQQLKSMGIGQDFR